MKSDIVDIDVYLHHRTAKAVLISLDGEKKNAVWVPLSQVELERNPGMPSAYVLTLPEWLALEKGLV